MILCHRRPASEINPGTLGPWCMGINCRSIPEAEKSIKELIARFGDLDYYIVEDTYKYSD